MPSALKQAIKNLYDKIAYDTPITFEEKKEFGPLFDEIWEAYNNENAAMTSAPLLPINKLARITAYESELKVENERLRELLRSAIGWIDLTLQLPGAPSGLIFDSLLVKLKAAAEANGGGDAS